MLQVNITDLLDAFVNLDVGYLHKLPNDLICSEGYKYELISQMDTLFSMQKALGITNLISKSSKCLFCHPSGKAYEFYNPLTGEYLFRYVFEVEKDGFLVIEPCKNNPIPDGPNGEPF